MGDSINKHLRDKRRDSGWTLLDLSWKMKVSVSFLSDVEHGRRRVNEELAAKYAVAFGESAKPLVEMVLNDRLARAGLTSMEATVKRRSA